MATTNKGKTLEYRHLLEGLPFKLVTPDEEGIDITVTEEGATLEENARSKATAYSNFSHLITLADDSGIEVDALGGEPGIRSARFAGEDASDEDRIKLLLRKLEGVPEEKRTAHFKCVIAIATPEKQLELLHGECPGFITHEAKGENGFGYDPVFYLPELDKTMAELPLEIKNQMSHRAKAAHKARQLLEQLAKRVKP